LDSLEDVEVGYDIACGRPDNGATECWGDQLYVHEWDEDCF